MELKSKKFKSFALSFWSLASCGRRRENLIPFKLRWRDQSLDNLLPLDNLTAITPSNKNLIWKAWSRYIVTWTSFPQFYPLHETTILERDVWVTVGPQLQNFCRSSGWKQSEELKERLSQALGLLPNSNYTHFIEFWSNTGNIFRACKDPEIDDTICSLDFPSSITKGHKHYDWFHKNLENNSYPWTRLGYTFDWATTEPSFGFSEFVVGSGSEVQIHKVMTTQEYCK